MPETATNFDQDYLGFFRHGVDDKRRLQIPARWRPARENFELTVMIWTAHEAGPCLRVFAPKEMRELREKLTSMPGDDPAKEELLHFIGKNSDKLPVDKSGRVCLPERLALEAGLNGEAVLVGLINKFEIWSADRYGIHAERFGAPRREFFNVIK
jgi:MraZ protein